jgi:hypothetical protein
MSANFKKNPETKIKVSEETRKIIFEDVEECYKSDIREAIQGKKCWRHTGLTFETISKITVAIGGVLSFSSGYFGSDVLSFISGSVSVVSLALLQFGTFSFKQGKKQANDLNILLKKLDLDTMPVMEDEPDALAIGNERKVVDKGIHNTDGDITPDTVPDTVHELQENTVPNVASETGLDITLDSVPSHVQTGHLDEEIISPFTKSKIKNKKITIIEDSKPIDVKNDTCRDMDNIIPTGSKINI